MFSSQATFYAFLASVVPSGYAFHSEPSQPTQWPSVRVHWLADFAGTRSDRWVATVQIDLNVPNGARGELNRSAVALMRGLGIDAYQEPPRIRLQDYTDPSAPVDTDLWIDWVIPPGGGWKTMPQADPTALRQVLTLELRHPPL